MSAYVVEWRRRALADLTQIWLETADRAAVTDAVAQIDLRLHRDPAGSSTPVAEGLRKIVVPPIHAYIEIMEVRKVVLVEGVLLLLPPAQP